MLDWWVWLLVMAYRSREPCPPLYIPEGKSPSRLQYKSPNRITGSNVTRITCGEFLFGLNLLPSLRGTRGLCPTDLKSGPLLWFEAPLFLWICFLCIYQQESLNPFQQTMAYGIHSSFDHLHRHSNRLGYGGAGEGREEHQRPGLIFIIFHYVFLWFQDARH